MYVSVLFNDANGNGRDGLLKQILLLLVNVVLLVFFLIISYIAQF